MLSDTGSRRESIQKGYRLHKSNWQGQCVLVFALLIGGCANVSQKFTPTKKVNLEPFATTTIQMVNSIDYGLERDDSALTRPYLHAQDNVELKRLLALDAELYRILRGIVAYSVKIVNLSASAKTEKEQVEAFANYLDQLDKPALDYSIEQGKVTQQDYRDILIKIRQQENLLAAMQAAQPMIQFVLYRTDTLTIELKQQEAKAARSIEQAIDKDHANEITYVTILKSRRETILAGLIQIDQHYQRRTKSGSAQNSRAVIIHTGLKSTALTEANSRQLENELTLALVDVQKQIDLLEKDSNYYLRIHQELASLIKFHDQEVRKASGVIQLWAQAHTKMANGITDPADWFDVTNPTDGIFDLTKKLVIKR